MFSFTVEAGDILTFLITSNAICVLEVIRKVGGACWDSNSAPRKCSLAPTHITANNDFETCVLSGDRECRYLEGETHEGIGDHRRQTLFFCGHEPQCTPFNSLEALQRAKRVVEQQYAVVGVLEDMNSTLLAFERYIPRFFQGSLRLYWEELNTFNRINRNAFKPPVSEAVKQIVRANFTREIEFYEFCKQRLHMQLKALRDSSITLPAPTPNVRQIPNNYQYNIV
ncbi:jg2764 [Pararge aegeria aegeria]|uniref:Jg2764 protein n=1 Tax=Pararge aegeria aegeria TaxID=348720 RepID=A0A8S4QVH6_9NEOP|nr:jg2764 [Pararge aegeria aegeria]